VQGKGERARDTVIEWGCVCERERERERVYMNCAHAQFTNCDHVDMSYRYLEIYHINNLIYM